MSGIYIHIPYCKQKCHYCNFYSLANGKYRDEFVPALLHELELQKEYLTKEKVSTIYFGGGTPSLMGGKEIDQIIQSIGNYFEIDLDAEITLEANPDDLTVSKIRELKSTAINRLSIGIQSFEDQDLGFLNRVHTGKEALRCIKRSQEAGFNNLSIDLIYGIPTLDTFTWESNLMTALDLDIPHISAYALTVEEKTPLSVMIRKGKMHDVDEEKQQEHFDLLLELLEAHGFLHYEISNFCKPGMFARHNTSYWKGVSYLGIGPSAHSFNGKSRQWNVSNLGAYILSLQKDRIPNEMEILSPAQRFNEYVMMSLRTQWGCDLNLIRDQFGQEWQVRALKDAGKYLQNGLLKTENNILFLTREGKFRADGIAAELFRVDPLL